MAGCKKILIILAHAFLGWVLCAAVMGVGMAILPLNTTLIIHLILAPVFFFAISAVYFRKFNYTTPLQTAIIFTSFVVLMDFFVVAMIIQKSFTMFTSLIGTWIPFILIFLVLYFSGKSLVVNKKVEG